jgi:hypothetical protein
MIVFISLLAAPLLFMALYEYLDRRRLGIQPPDEPSRRPHYVLAGIICAVVLASIVYRLLMGLQLGQTAAAFIGIPAILAIATAFAPTRSAVGVGLKTVTIGLLISMIFLNEGVLCVLLSAPLFYAVALMMGWAISEIRTPQDRGRLLSFLPILAIVPMSMEGVLPSTTIDRAVTVSETRIVHAGAAEIAHAIASQPRFDRVLPTFLAIGFPRPSYTHYDGRRWVIQVRGGEMRLNGMEPRTGTLILERDAEGPGFINWTATADDSHMRHFLSWQTSRVEWTAIDAHTTRVTWTLTYHRDLDPAWYFGPMERYAVRLAAGYLIDAVATP